MRGWAGCAVLRLNHSDHPAVLPISAAKFTRL